MGRRYKNKLIVFLFIILMLSLNICMAGISGGVFVENKLNTNNMKLGADFVMNLKLLLDEEGNTLPLAIYATGCLESEVNQIGNEDFIGWEYTVGAEIGRHLYMRIERQAEGNPDKDETEDYFIRCGIRF